MITSLGAVSSLVDAVHSYGGVVFHDVANIKHARKASAVVLLVCWMSIAPMRYF